MDIRVRSNSDSNYPGPNNLEQKVGLNVANRMVKLFQIYSFRKINLKQLVPVNDCQQIGYRDGAV